MFLISQASRLTLGVFQLSVAEALSSEGKQLVVEADQSPPSNTELRKYGSEIVLLRGRYAALKSILMLMFREILLVLSSQVL